MHLNVDAPMLRRVERAFLPHTPDRVGVAVSGGGDSMALLVLFARMAAGTGKTVMAVTVDHGLRAGSAAEAAMVAQVCKSLNIPHQTIEWNDWDGHGNLQAVARTARYRLITDWARANDLGGVALGHTMDDNAENYLMRLGRKAGIDGLAMMQTTFMRNGMLWARPLWQARRADLRDYLTRQDIHWAEDPSNDDVDFDRVRVRKAMVALDELGLSTQALQHASVAARQARDALEHYMRIEAGAHVTVQHGDLIMPREPDMPADILRRLKSAALQWISGLDYPPRQSSITHMETGLAIDGQATVAGCLVTANETHLRFAREANAVKMTTTPTDAVWDGRWKFDGPHDAQLNIKMLGEGIRDCPDWRDAVLPRTSVMGSPAVWRGETLISAPLAGLQNGWTARIVADFHSSLVTH